MWSEEKSKIARRCGEKHILKWKCTKHVSFGPLLEVTMSKNCTPLWREAHFEVKMYKTRQLRTTFRSYDVEKLHAAVARSAFSTENAKKLGGSEHFLKLRCWKIARRCGEKRILKWKFTNQLRTTFRSYDVEKLHAAVARSAFSTENAKKLTVSEHFLKFRCRKIARRCGEKHICKSKCAKSLCFLLHFLKFRCRKISQVVR